jgi:hypothetical protein
MISRIIQLKNVFAENHGLVSVIDIVPYSSKPPLKLGCIEMQIGEKRLFMLLCIIVFGLLTSRHGYTGVTCTHTITCD